MNIQFFKGSKYTFIAMGILSVVIIGFLYKINNKPKTLPIYNPTDINPRLVDDSMLSIGKNHTIGPFELIDQNGKTITEQNFKNKIYVADFFFTRCGTICPIMSNHLEKVQQAYKNNSKVKLLSHSVTPEMDSVPVLKDYAQAHHAINNKWHLTTGSKKTIYNLARKNYFSVLDEGDGGLQDFIHTEQFVLIDTKKRIRGFYDGTSVKEVNQLIADIAVLLNEKEQ